MNFTSRGSLLTPSLLLYAVWLCGTPYYFQRLLCYNTDCIHVHENLTVEEAIYLNLTKHKTAANPNICTNQVRTVTYKVMAINYRETKPWFNPANLNPVIVIVYC